MGCEKLFADIQSHPLAGTIPEEASNLGRVLRQRIIEQIRVIYEVRDDTVYVRMVLSTRRDFTAHLIERLLQP
jgi:Txe/YoeB family toxin of Txe-Axe toxin-antitoxin module